MQEVLFLLLSLLLVKSILATSSGVGIYDCDVYSPYFGCAESDWTDGNRKQCVQKDTNVMSWVKKPERTNYYQLFVGTEENGPAQTSYVGDEFVTVGIIQTNYSLRWRGLLLYADDENGDKVGEWQIFDENPIFYHSPISSCSGEPVVLHAGGVIKQGKQLFNFRAPAGTGTITFRALIKEGDANVGSFFWPNNADVSLTESTTVSSGPTWEMTETGQSCREHCEMKSLFCDTEALLDIGNGDIISSEISPFYRCKLPYLSSCSNLGPFQGPGDYCSFQDTLRTCVEAGRDYDLPRCDAKSDDTRRFCICSGDSSVQNDPTEIPEDPTEWIFETEIDSEDTYHNGSSLITANIMLLLSLIGMKLNSKNQSNILLILVVSVCLLNTVSSHNWINSPSRSLIASTYKPCLPRTGNKPHVQVGPGQSFLVEWMQGHTDQPPTHFALVREEYAGNMTSHTTALLDEYLADAIAKGKTNTAKNSVHQRLHWTPADNDGTGYGDEVTGASSLWIDRPAQFTEGGNTAHRLWQYNTADLDNDIRVEHDHDEYTWILSAHKFPHTYEQPGRYDTARFTIPAGAPFGRYILQYIWSGYYDCVDIDYIDQQVEFIYGYEDPEEPVTFSRIDHCYFPGIVRDGIYWPSGPYKRVLDGDPTICLDHCRDYGTECQHVQVLPLYTPSTVRPEWADYNGLSQTLDLPQYTGSRISWDPEIWDYNYDDLIGNHTGPEEYICYDLSPRVHTQTEDIYITSTNPEDPVFYGSCYVMDNKKVFIGITNEVIEPRQVPWRYGDKCISCEDHSRISSSEYHAPIWRFTDTCVNCDKEPGTATKERVKFEVIRAHAWCDGGCHWENKSEYEVYNIHRTCEEDVDTVRCTIMLGTEGEPNNRFSLEECALLASDNDLCSVHFMYTDTPDSWDGKGQCFCHTNHECCHICSATEDWIGPEWSIYEIQKEEPIPDPTCATGTLSFDGDHCCSGECGYGQCVDNVDKREAYGFCCSTCIPEHRTCDVYGPPCNLV